MKIYVGVTDNQWFEFLSSRSDLDEVNFWQPSGKSTLRAIQPGELFLFKFSAPYEIRNSVLLLNDMHKLFDRGYLTITPKLHIKVSSRIKEEFDNGEYYFTFHGQLVHKPKRYEDWPSEEFLTWHNENIFWI